MGIGIKVCRRSLTSFTAKKEESSSAAPRLPAPLKAAPVASKKRKEAPVEEEPALARKKGRMAKVAPVKAATVVNKKRKQADVEREQTVTKTSFRGAGS